MSNKSTFVTNSGQVITPDWGTFTMRDVAIQSSRIFRYAGATEKPWPLILHSIAVGRLLYESHGPLLGFYGLFHDGHEVVTSDIPRGFKTDDIRELQGKIQDRFWTSVGLNPPGVEQRIIDQADSDTGMAEMIDGEIGTSAYLSLYGKRRYSEGVNKAITIHNDLVSNYAPTPSSIVGGWVVDDFMDLAYSWLGEAHGMRGALSDNPARAED